MKARTVFVWAASKCSIAGAHISAHPRPISANVELFTVNGEHYESTYHTRTDHRSTAVLGSGPISKRFACSTKVAQRPTRRHLDPRLIGSGAPGWQQIATV